MLSDGHSVTAAGLRRRKYLENGHITFAGPNGAALPTVADFYPLLDTPARTSDQRLVVASDLGDVIFLQNATVLASVPLSAETIASPAVSLNHVYVSTASSLRTLNALTMTEVGRYDWISGGRSAPAIGPSGSVYALAGSTLYVWPGRPKRR